MGVAVKEAAGSYAANTTEHIVKKLWIYDLRTNKEFALKQRRMTRADLKLFETQRT